MLYCFLKFGIQSANPAIRCKNIADMTLIDSRESASLTARKVGCIVSDINIHLLDISLNKTLNVALLRFFDSLVRI